MRPVVLFLVYVSLFLSSVVAFSYEFTVTIEPGKEDCYFITVAKNVYLEVDYQVPKKKISIKQRRFFYRLNSIFQGY